MPFVSVAEATEEIRAGRILVVVDDEDRENEGDLTIAAEKVTPEIVNFMVTHGRGLICLALTPDRCDYLRLPLMSAQNTSRFGTAFCETIDAREGVTTGVSAADRTRTILAAIDPLCRPGDLARPGHIFPLRAQDGGVLVRAGQTEASVDLARFAGLTPAGVICEVMNPDGTMARVPQLREVCAPGRPAPPPPAPARGPPPPQPQNDFRGRPHPPPHEARTLRPPRGRRLSPDRVRRVPRHHLRQPPQSRIPPGAGSRRPGRPGERPGPHARPLPLRRC